MLKQGILAVDHRADTCQFHRMDFHPVAGIWRSLCCRTAHRDPKGCYKEKITLQFIQWKCYGKILSGSQKLDLIGKQFDGEIPPVNSSQCILEQHCLSTRDSACILITALIQSDNSYIHMHREHPRPFAHTSQSIFIPTPMSCTHVSPTLQVCKVDIRDEQDRLSIQVHEGLEDGDVSTFV